MGMMSTEEEVKKIGEDYGFRIGINCDTLEGGAIFQIHKLRE
jgi:hypothetical protein